ncbi:hypothetical protein HMPREF9943_01445 [Eggerthia catenaformis OT 569 = DSM 20559]|uniref:Uncharacterized protein n=1 Tax=Eggerthia catenaformis OT 569 = DSM 20559 TaxID=999415 RepID=M2PL92_9FIRM|nr:hypothetical protein [Eggerthia catenaformis]EMD16324.1 hypothetical protein HMPREF9943_01445 [Eggerthia catenaformis OT 569 = DSM 20559]
MKPKMSYRQYYMAVEVRYPLYIEILRKIAAILSFSFLIIIFLNGKLIFIPVELLYYSFIFLVCYIVVLIILACKAAIKQYREYLHDDNDDLPTISG